MGYASADIDMLASRCVGPHIHRAIALIEAKISSATQAGDWDEVQKWHQVKLRVKRMRTAADATQNYVMRRQQCL